MEMHPPSQDIIGTGVNDCKLRGELEPARQVAHADGVI